MNQIIREDMEKMCSNNLVDWQRFNGKTVLVTGAYGMLAAYMVYALIYLNEFHSQFHVNIIALGRNREKCAEKYGAYFEKPYFHFLEADVNTLRDDCFESFSKIDFIIHGASPADSQYYGKIPVDVLKPNVLGTYHLLELARLQSSEGFLFLSTGAIYGQNPKLELRECDAGYVDSMDLRSCYAESKRMGENMCKSFAVQYGVPAKVVRISHTFGPTMELQNDNRAVCEFVSNVVNGQNIEMKSDGGAVRNFCYIADAVLGYFKILLDGENGEAYNVCNKNGALSIMELAEMLVSLCPEKNLRIVIKARQADTGYLEDKTKKHAAQNTEKLEALGWTCSYSISDGFSRTIRSFDKLYGGI